MNTASPQQLWKETFSELWQVSKQRIENYRQLNRALSKPTFAKLFMTLDEHIEHEEKLLADYERKERIAETREEELSQKMEPLETKMEIAELEQKLEQLKAKLEASALLPNSPADPVDTEEQTYKFLNIPAFICHSVMLK